MKAAAFVDTAGDRLPTLGMTSGLRRRLLLMLIAAVNGSGCCLTGA